MNELSEDTLPVPQQDFKLIKESGHWYIQTNEGGGSLILANDFIVALWIEREKLIDRIHQLGSHE